MSIARSSGIALLNARSAVSVAVLPPTVMHLIYLWRDRTNSSPSSAQHLSDVDVISEITHTLVLPHVEQPQAPGLSSQILLRALLRVPGETELPRKVERSGWPDLDQKQNVVGVQGRAGRRRLNFPMEGSGIGFHCVGTAARSARKSAKTSILARGLAPDSGC